jgi:hypothetical protein
MPHDGRKLLVLFMHVLVLRHQRNHLFVPAFERRGKALQSRGFAGDPPRLIDQGRLVLEGCGQRRANLLDGFKLRRQVIAQMSDSRFQCPLLLFGFTEQRGLVCLVQGERFDSRNGLRSEAVPGFRAQELMQGQGKNGGRGAPSQRCQQVLFDHD